MNKANIFFLLFVLFIASSIIASAQQVTGVWKGKINNQKVELKIIQRGDSLFGTSYYHSLTGGQKRFSIKGYFDAYSNSVVWWDDELITAKGSNAITNKFISVADFNCPGGGKMFLDGKSSKKEEPRNVTGEVNLTKVPNPSFNDEWDYVLDNFSVGGNHPDIIDSIRRIAFTPTIKKNEEIPVKPEPVIAKAPQLSKPKPVIPIKRKSDSEPAVVKTSTVTKSIPPFVMVDKPNKPTPPKPATIEDLFTSRKKVFAKEIPLEGDSIQLHFYDNAEVDGDSITLYLNNKLLFTHVRLTAQPYIIMLAVKDLADTNELVMVAENLGSIPPNTAFMIAMVAGKRHEAFLESNEGSSSLIRFTKLKAP